MSNRNMTSKTVEPGQASSKARSVRDNAKAAENASRVEAINEGREQVKNAIVSILTGGPVEAAEQACEEAVAKVQATERPRAERHPLYQEAVDLKKAGKRGPGRKLTNAELLGYIEQVKTARPDTTASQELEIGYWVEGLALTRTRWMAAWNGETLPEPQAKASAPAQSKAAERIANLAAMKADVAAAKTAVDGSKVDPPKQPAKVAAARKSQQAPPVAAATA